MRNHRNGLVALLVALAAFGAACADDAPTAGPAQPSGTNRTAPTDPAAPTDPGTTVGGGGSGRLLRLAPFDSCDAFLAHVKQQAASRVGPYGLDGGGGGWPMPMSVEDMTAATAAPSDTAAPTMAASESDSAAGAAYTNVQEAGIDEPDLVKTDGERIVAVVGTTLYLVSTDAAGPSVLGSLELTSAPHELALHGDRAFAFANEWPYDEMAYDTDAMLPGPGGSPSTVVSEVSLADPAAPSVVATARVEGNYLSARLIDDRLRVAVSHTPAALPWLYPSTPTSEEAAEEANRRIIEESSLADWTPAYTLIVGDAVSEGELLPCERLHHPAEFAGFDVVSVLDLDLTADGALAAALTSRAAAVGVLGAGHTVYSSHDRMYLATTRWTPDGANVSTSIHAFALAADAPTEYVASGEVDGTLLSQFSLDEHAGYLRVAVTDEATAQGGSESRLVVLAEDGDTLVPVGEVGGLGHGERLYSVRLMGDVGFAVTFRQVDPFYVLDLSDPTDPRVVGELKIPGFSTYLHPLGDVAETGLVLGVGQDATEQGAVQGLKLSVFDVSDPSAPTEVAKWVLPNASSGAEYDHRAFQIHGTTVILPVQDWSAGFAGAVVLDVTDGTIAEVGRVEHVLDDPTGSDCRQLTADDFPEEDSSFYWEVRSGAIVQVCGANDTGGWSGLPDACWSEAPELLTNVFYSPEAYEAAVERLGLGAGDRIEVCYPGNPQPPIERSFVIGDALWTYSRGRLQANALDGLGLLGGVALGG
jgi:hypothetical protein